MENEDDEETVGKEMEEEGEGNEGEEEDIATPEVPKPKDPLEINFTPEELREREQRRLKKSWCCFAEGWDLHRKLSNPLEVRRYGQQIEDEIDEEKEQTESISDPQAWRRVVFMERKLDGFRRALHLLGGAAHPPLIRITTKTLLDKEGRGYRTPHATQTLMKEVAVNYDHPRTLAHRQVTSNVTNLNFQQWEQAVEITYSETQTDGTGQTYNTTSTQSDPSEQDDAGSGHANDDDIDGHGDGDDGDGDDGDGDDDGDDDDGPAVAQVTLKPRFGSEPMADVVDPGLVRSGQGILPWPTFHERMVATDQASLYCCNDYKMFCEDTLKMEEKLQAEKDAKNKKINIKPHKHHTPHIPKTSEKNVAPPTKWQITKEEKKGDRAKTTRFDKSQDDSRGKKGKKGGDDKEKKPKSDTDDTKKGKKGRKHRKDSNAPITFEDKAVDTFSLPWDPYESRFGHSRFFNDEIFDDALSHCYDHPLIAMQQDEFYESTPLDVKTK